MTKSLLLCGATVPHAPSVRKSCNRKSNAIEAHDGPKIWDFLALNASHPSPGAEGPFSPALAAVLHALGLHLQTRCVAGSC